MDVLGVRKEHGPVGLLVDQEFAVTGEEPVRSGVAVPRKRRSGTTSPSVAFTLGDGLPGMPSVSETVLPARSCPLIEGSDGFHFAVAVEVGEDLPYRFSGCLDRKHRAIDSHTEAR